MLTIKTYQAKEVTALIKSGEMLQWPILPISPYRANSILHAPSCADTDITLACAFNNQQLVGYLGLVPGMLQQQKIGWLSSMWVDEKQRGQGIAGKLINALYQAWDGQIITTNQSPAAAFVFRKNAFFSELPQAGCRYYYKSRLSKLLPQKNAAFKWIKPALSAFDYAFNGIKKLMLPNQAVVYKTVNEVTPEIETFIAKHKLETSTRLGHSELLWMMKYPWVIKQQSMHELAHKYEFTISTTDYLNAFLVVYNSAGTEPEAICLIMLKNGSLKISYAWYTNTQPIKKALQHFIQNHLIYDITVYHKHHLQLVPNNYFFSKIQQRPYFISKLLYKKLTQQNLNLFDGDGDCCFA